MKILLLGEYSNVHATLARGLRELGHQVTLISNGDFWKNYPRDIDVSRKPGRWGGISLMARIMLLLPKMSGYDVVQLINPLFFELKAERLRPIYQYLRNHNKKIILCGFGMDWYWLNACTKFRLRYSDFNFGNQLRTDDIAMRDKKAWTNTAKVSLNKYIAQDCDAIVTGLYEYWISYHPEFPEKTVFIPFPIVVPPTYSTDTASKLRLFIGISKGRSAYKGTDIMLQAAEDIVQKYPGQVELQKAEGVSFSEYTSMMEGSDAILDQLYSYTPSMNPLEAMSKGIICIGGGEPENYEILGETELHPIINVQPNYDSVFHELEQLILHPERITLLKRQSRQYIERHHDYILVARKYLALYEK
jgi:hypothetical protein